MKPTRFSSVQVRILVAVGATAAIGGCASTPSPDSVFATQSSLSPVMTEHSASLKCLGALINETGRRPVSVIVNDIDDTTVPLLNEERRLSMGGQYVLRTALSRMDSELVQPVLDQDRSGPRAIEFTGAWTQDDQVNTEGGLSVRARLGNYSGALGGRAGYDFIAGDFATSEKGRVLLSTAVGVALSRKGESALLVVDDGYDRAEVGIDRAAVDGPQMAQRRILEAVALVHIARYFDIDYRPCLETSYASPQAFQSAIRDYNAARPVDQARMSQEELARLSYLEGQIDGQWGPASRAALLRFQTAMNLPPTGEPSAVTFALIKTTPATPKTLEKS